MPRRLLTLLAIALVPLGACAGADTARDEGVRVAVTQRPWAAVTRAIAGDRATVVDAGARPGSDPHLFEPDARTAAELAGADVVVLNGADLDHWAEELVGGDAGGRRVVTASEVLGIDETGVDPHLWFDLAGVPAVARAVTDALVAADPAGRRDYERGRDRFLAELRPVRAAASRLRDAHRDAPVAATERVIDRLLTTAGLRVVSPVGFAVAVEEGEEPSARDTAAMDALLSGGGARLLVYNTDAATPAAEAVRGVAARNDVPVVLVSESLPAGVTSYPEWVGSIVDALRRALPAAP